MIQKDPKHLRIILQNPNGISPENDLFEYEYCLQQMHSLCADVILLPESNLFWPTYSIQKSMNNHRRNIHRHSKQITSCSTKSYGSVYQPGGTCSIITGHATGRFHSSQRDEQLGRWSVPVRLIRPIYNLLLPSLQGHNQNLWSKNCLLATMVSASRLRCLASQSKTSVYQRPGQAPENPHQLRQLNCPCRRLQ